ncbi:MAG: hypothetical protein ABSF67_07905 [Roseiarcus sp.]|jgi:hypothetical protein
MSTVQAEVFEALRAIDIPEDKALKAAIVLSKPNDDVLSKRNDEVANLKRDIVILTWMTGFMLALQIAIVLKLFMH